MSHNTVAAVDRTTTRVKVPMGKEHKDTRKSYWNGKYKTWGVSTLLLVLLNGIIIAYTPPSTPNSDQALWKRSKLRNFVVDKPWGVVGDSGFTFNPAYESIKIRGFNVLKSSAKKPLTEAEKQYNSDLTKSRAVVENTNAQLKKWEVFKSFPHYVSYTLPDSRRHNTFAIEQVLPVLIMLTNRKIKRSPLRKEYWIHPHLLQHLQPVSQD